MPRANFTNRFVASLHPTTTVVYFDLKARGLALRAFACGRQDVDVRPSHWRPANVDRWASLLGAILLAIFAHAFLPR